MTFMWPRKAWHTLYEPAIRASAGLGVAPTVADPDAYAQRYAHCDVLVVGAGPAGLAAALAAGATGARVVLADEQPVLGGSLLDEPAATIDGVDSTAWLAQAETSLAGLKNVTVLRRTTAFGFAQPHRPVRAPDRSPRRAGARRGPRAAVAGAGG